MGPHQSPDLIMAGDRDLHEADIAHRTAIAVPDESHRRCKTLIDPEVGDGVIVSVEMGGQIGDEKTRFP